MTLSDDQVRFIRFHQRKLVTAWRWFMGESQLRAETDSGETATIWARSLSELLDLGLVERGRGFDVRLTAEGMRV